VWLDQAFQGNTRHGVYQDLEVQGCCRRSGGMLDLDPRSRGREACRAGGGFGRGRPSSKGGSGCNLGKFFKFHVQNPAFWRTFGCVS
jgi:hypothetical protein